MPTVIETSWWLDYSGLPDQLLWMRLNVFSDGTAEVLDLDGRYRRFCDRQQAIFWMAEDEYSPWEGLVEDGEVSADVTHPQAKNDEELIPLMCAHREKGL